MRVGRLDRKQQAVTLAALLALGTFFSATSASATTTCQPTPQGNLCISEVDFRRFSQEAYMAQMKPEWCWAASISMVFAFYGHPVSQSRIVTEVYGAPENIPALSGITIASELNRNWVDDAGSAFSSRLTGAYDAQAGVNTLTNAQIISELGQDHPMVIGARTHAMVLTAIQYYQTAQGPYVVAAGVFDPWPGIGARGLEIDELTEQAQGGSLLFAVTVRVADQPKPPSPPAGGSGPMPSGGSGPRPDAGSGDQTSGGAAEETGGRSGVIVEPPPSTSAGSGCSVGGATRESSALSDALLFAFVVASVLRGRSTAQRISMSARANTIFRLS